MNDTLVPVTPSKVVDQTPHDVVARRMPDVVGSVQFRIKNLWGNCFRINYYNAQNNIIESYFMEVRGDQLVNHTLSDREEYKKKSKQNVKF